MGEFMMDVEVYQFDNNYIEYVLDVYGAVEAYNSIFDNIAVGGFLTKHEEEKLYDRYHLVMNMAYSEELLKQIEQIEKEEWIPKELKPLWEESVQLFEFREEPVSLEGKWLNMMHLCMKEPEQIDFLLDVAKPLMGRAEQIDNTLMEVYKRGQMLTPRKEKRISKK